MWIALEVVSALLLGIHDVFKKISVTGNNVLTVLFLNTLFGALLQSFIVLSSWVLGYFAVKHLPAC